MKISEIKPYLKNAKKHPKKQIEQIASSIKEFGFAQPIVLDKNNVVIVGHGRLEAAKLLGLDDVPTITVDLNEEQAKAYRLADNKLNESEWDMSLVIDELKELSDEMFNLTGFDKDLIIEPDEKDDVIPENVPARSALGDLYELGGHRVLCGDSTKVEDVERLMDGKKADMVFTDPPYNVNYSGHGTNTKKGILNDKLSDTDFIEFLYESFKRISENIKRTSGCYIFHSHKTASQFEANLIKAGFIIDTQLIWNKPSGGYGMNDYRAKHEPFFYAYLSKEEKIFYGDRTNTTVWRIPKDPIKAIKWFTQNMEAREKGDTTIWSMSRSNVNEYQHPTQKPVELALTAILKSSKPDDIVLDLFLGGGSTLIASEKTGRICYGMELDEKYIDVIVQRYVDYTGNENIIKNGNNIIWNKSQKTPIKTPIND